MLLRTVTLESFRTFQKINVELEPITVLIGENNTGKTSFLDSLQLVLTRNPSCRTAIFEEYDFHLAAADKQPGDSGPIVVTLDFSERGENEWSAEIRQDLADVIVYDDQNLGHVIFQVRGIRNQQTREFDTEWAFLDAAGNPHSQDKQRLSNVTKLQNLVPTFYLAALRDATREFQSRGRYWSPFLRDSPITPEVQKELEQELTSLNDKVIQAHQPLKDVRDYLRKAQQIVTLADTEPVSIDALPSRIFDMLARAQVNVKTPSGVTLPLGRHGSGTQSLSVILLPVRR